MRIIRINIFSFILIYFSYTLVVFGQSIRIQGIVYNVISNAPVSGVKIAIKGNESFCTSNENGEYVLPLSEQSDSVVFSNIEGMDLLEVKKMGENTYDLFLSEKSLPELSISELMKVKVTTAGKQEQNINDVPASMVIITRKDIVRAGYKDLNEILENIPGFYSLGNAYNEGGTNFGIRGFSSGGALSDFMIMVNGVSQIQDFSNSFSTDKIIVPVEAIDRIEVVRGPNAVIYGSNAFMGAVNIITNDVSDKNRSVIATGFGSNETYRGVAHIVGKKEDLSFVFNGSVIKTNGLNVKYSDMQSNPNVIQSWGLPSDASTKGQFAGFQKSVELSSKYKGFNFMLLHANNEQGTPGSKPSANREMGFLLNTVNTTMLLGYEKKWSEKVKLNSKLTYYDYHQNGDPHFNYANSYNLFVTKTNGYDAEISALYKPAKQFDLLIGLNNHTALEANRTIDFSTSTVDFRNFKYGLASNQNLVVNSAFTQFNFRPVKQLILVAGMRAEKTNAFDIQAFHDYTLNTSTNKDTTVLIQVGKTAYDQIQFIPRLAAIFQLNRNNTLKCMFGQSRKRPSILEDVNLAARNLYGLKFAQMQTFELSYTLSLSRNFLISTSTYYNDLENLVLRNIVVSPSGAISAQAANAGTMKTYGMSLSAKLEPVSNLSFDLSASYQTTENDTKGYLATASYSPNLLGYINATYSIRKMVFCVFSTYVDKMKSGWNINPDPNKSTWYGNDVSEYVKLNANIRVNEVWKGLYLSLHATNLLDQKIQFPTTPNSTWTDKGMLGFGRFFQLTFGYQL